MTRRGRAWTTNRTPQGSTVTSSARYWSLPGFLTLERRLGVRDLQDVGQALAILSETKQLIDRRPELFAVILPSPTETALDVEPTDPDEDVNDTDMQ